MAEAIADRAAVGIAARTAADPRDIKELALGVADGQAVVALVAAGAGPVVVDPAAADLMRANPVRAVRGAAAIARNVESARSATTGAVGRQRVFDLLD